MSQPAVLTINIDGAARGNPGPAAYAYVIEGQGQPLIEHAGCLGHATNNYAEYMALVKALERAAELTGQHLLIRSDSDLLVKQMNGLYRVKNPDLRVLHQQAKQLFDRFQSVSIRHVPREQNSEADRLCNEALDGPLPKKRAGSPSSKTLTSFSHTDSALEGRVRDEAVRCLRAAASAWSKGDSNSPSPEAVWDQLWSILEEEGVLRRKKS